MLKQFVDDGFRIIKSNKKKSQWVTEFNNLPENVSMDKWNFKKIMLCLWTYS